MDLVGATTVGQTMAVVAAAGVVVANDSAPLHMAVGFERPCVGLFGPTDPATVGPFRAERSVVRAPGGASAHFKDPSIGDSVMRRIDVETVIERIDQVLGREPVAEETA